MRRFADSVRERIANPQFVTEDDIVRAIIDALADPEIPDREEWEWRIVRDVADRIKATDPRFR